MSTAESLRFDLPAPDISAWRAGNTGVEGVWQFDSGLPGRHVLVTALVHGNEVCGAWALRSLPAMALRWLVDSNCKAGADTCNGPPGPAQYGHWLGSLRWAIGRNIVNVPHASQAYS